MPKREAPASPPAPPLPLVGGVGGGNVTDAPPDLAPALTELGLAAALAGRDAAAVVMVWNDWKTRLPVSLDRFHTYLLPIDVARDVIDRGSARLATAEDLAIAGPQLRNLTEGSTTDA